MIKVLVTGTNSYIGNSFKNYMAQWPNEYSIHTISLRDASWKRLDFSEFDVIFHVAGIAHQKETTDNAGLYYEVNRDLAIEIAEKAKKDKVSQFILLSTMSVYGKETGVITKETVPEPNTHYGKSKLESETKILPLQSETFKVVILRPPMVYGKGCKGNFQSLISFTRLLPVLPRLSNQRSSIYVDNLSNFVKKLIDGHLSGLYFPQNSEYMCTTQMMAWISESIGKKPYMSRLLGACVKLLMPFSSSARKAFGTLIYKDMEEINSDHCVVDAEESVKRSV